MKRTLKAYTEAIGYTAQLRNMGIDSMRATNRPPHLNSVPKSQHPYNWNHVDWHLGASYNFLPVVISTRPALMEKPAADYDFLDYADLVAVSPFPGAVLYWLQPKEGGEVEAVRKRLPNDNQRKLVRPRGWRYDGPVLAPPPKYPLPQQAPVPPPPPYQPPLFPWPPDRIPIKLPSVGGGYAATSRCDGERSGEAGQLTP